MRYEFWAIQWIDEDRGFLISATSCVPVLFPNRKLAREYKNNLRAYIPHGWKMSVPVKVKVELVKK